MKEMSLDQFAMLACETLEQVAQEKEPLVVTKEGRPLVTVMPAEPDAPSAITMGRLAGTAIIHGDIVSPVVEPEDWEACR